MAVAVSCVAVTGNPQEDKQVAASDVARTSLRILNLSGADVELHYGTSATAQFETLEPSGQFKRILLSGNDSVPEVRAICRTAALALRVSKVTA